MAQALHPPSRRPADASANLERVARSEEAEPDNRRAALWFLATLDAEAGSAAAASLLLSQQAGDRAAAWGVAKRHAPDALRRAAVAALPSAGDGEAKTLYWDLRDVAQTDDCGVLLPIVSSETQLADRIAGWSLLAQLGCQAARVPMRALLSDQDLGSRLLQPLASYRDAALIPDLLSACQGREDSLHRRRRILALSTCLDRRTVPGLVHALSHANPAIRLGAATALRDAIAERAEHASHTSEGQLDFTWGRLDRPHVRAALNRARSDADPAVAARTHEALAALAALADR